jgi:hypothetical protein
MLTLDQIADRYDLSLDDTLALRDQLHGKALRLPVFGDVMTGPPYYRWHDVEAALAEVTRSTRTGLSGGRNGHSGNTFAA